MTEEQYTEIKNIFDKIQSNKEQIRKISYLIQTCGIKCTIEGSPRGSFITQSYDSYDSVSIKEFLLQERERLTSQLSELETHFQNI